MSTARTIPLLLLAVLAGGCATGATPEGMTWAGPAALDEIEAVAASDRPTLTLHVTGGSETNPLHTSRIANDAFAEALLTEIVRRGVFRPVHDEIADYHLHVDLAEIERPYWGWLDMEVVIRADWRLRAHETGRLVWERRVESAYTATGNDSQWGIRRLRLAHEGSARHNIVEGVTALARVAPPTRPGRGAAER